MEQVIKEYLNINAPKYAEFKEYDENFIKAVNEFTEGAEPTEQVQLFYDEAMDTVKKFLEGGLIPKFQWGGAGVSAANNNIDLRATWRRDVFEKLQQELINKLKLGLEGKEGGITKDLFNNYQSSHANIYNRIKDTDFYTKAYRPETKGEVSALQKIYQDNGFNDLAIAPNWESRYHINSSSPTSGDKIGQWTTDDLYSGITDDRRFGRDGDWEPKQLEAFQNELAKLGYTYTLDKNDWYYKLGRIDTQEKPQIGADEIISESPLEAKPNPTPKLIGLEPAVPLKEGKNAPPIEDEIKNTNDLESGLPLLKLKPFTLGDKISEMFPDLFETAKFYDSLRTNKRMKDLFQREYAYATEEYRPKHLNIYGDLASLNQGYNEAANLRLKANRLGANTSDYRTAVAINLQGEQQAEQGQATARKMYNELARSTAEKSRQQMFENIDKEQAVANENFGRGVAAHNMRLNNILEYMNLQHANRKDYLDYWETKFVLKELDKKQFASNMLEKQMERAVENNSSVLAAKQAYDEAKTQEEKQSAWENYIKIKQTVLREILPRYYQLLARIKGFNYSMEDPFRDFYLKSGGKISDDGPVRKRTKDLERHRKERSDARRYNDKKLDRLGRLTYLYAKRAQGK